MLPAIFDLEGLKLTNEEKSFFKDANPHGYIIFGRNVENPEQLRALTDSLKELSGNEHLPILIDQEGGRVARLKPPHWPHFLSAQALVRQGNGDAEEARKIIYNNALRLGEVLNQAGITVNCAPVADIPVEGSDPIISDRAYGDNPKDVAFYARAMADGLLDSGVMPVLKHIPGHGRATVDSHITLPTVDTSLEELQRTEFEAFKALNDLPYAMTAHIVYNALDRGNCATFSRKVIKYIREEIGFDGLIMTDAVNMKALSGSYLDRTKKALDAGCDLVLYCDGDENISLAQKKAAAEIMPQASDRVVSLTKAMFEQSASPLKHEYA